MKINIMCGIQGSGKSTIAMKQYTEAVSNGTTAVYISRDIIRFSLLGEEDDYFAKEDEVWETFVNKINNSILDGIEEIYVDATNVAIGSRKKLLNSILPAHGYDVVFQVVHTPLSVCLDRNKMREGRAQVPSSVIRNTALRFEFPTYEELERFNDKFKSIVIRKVEGI